MYEKGSSVKVTVCIGEAGVTEMEFVGKVVIDGSDFMAVQFDTIIIPKMDIRSAEPIPDGQSLEQLLGAERMAADGVERPKPPTVEDVRFLSQAPEADAQEPQRSQAPRQPQQPHAQRPQPRKK
jgi:hypothetical protein